MGSDSYAETLGEREKILFCNEAFYSAFRNADVSAMESLWADAAPVACIHPGWPPLTERNDVMASWRGIFAKSPRPGITMQRPRVILSDGFAFVICFERIGGAHLVATNIFRKENGHWKLVHHHAGPTYGGEDEGEDRTEPPLQ